jgi:hypothetical protein
MVIILIVDAEFKDQEWTYSENVNQQGNGPTLY